MNLNVKNFNTTNKDELTFLNLLKRNKFEIDFFDFFRDDESYIYNTFFYDKKISIQYDNKQYKFIIRLYHDPMIILHSFFLKDIIKYIKVNYSYKNRLLKLQSIYDTI